MTADNDASIRDKTIGRYSALARSAMEGDRITDCEGDAFTAGCFGASAYLDQADAPAAALGVSLGCGNPVAVADLRPGETVLDLGSGGGLDVLLSARRVGPSGVAYGLDGSADMLALARTNADRAGITNAAFLEGVIEDIPLPTGHVDVVISNCVVNLSTDKRAVLAEAFRVLKQGGRVGISDVIHDEDLNAGPRAGAETRIGCTSGTLSRSEYQDMLAAVGFTGISITTTSAAGGGLYSAIVQAVKPAK
jgi:SAM-dependent methyltransferase